MGRWGDGEMGRWGDEEIKNPLLHHHPLLATPYFLLSTPRLLTLNSFTGTQG
ncbi:MAG: hypothetical protein WBA39_25300 [Rivularia sp. (in: cyanobacteria)]